MDLAIQEEVAEGEVKVKKLERFVDERGEFREILRNTELESEEMAQVSISIVYTGIVKAWHLHWQQTEWMSSVTGVVRFAFYDLRPGKNRNKKCSEYLIDARVNPLLFCIPPGIAHGYRIVEGPATILYITNQIYNPSDQIKVPFDSKDIPYNWNGPAIS